MKKKSNFVLMMIDRISGVSSELEHFTFERRRLPLALGLLIVRIHLQEFNGLGLIMTNIPGENQSNQQISQVDPNQIIDLYYSNV